MKGKLKKEDSISPLSTNPIPKKGNLHKAKQTPVKKSVSYEPHKSNQKPYPVKHPSIQEPKVGETPELQQDTALPSDHQLDQSSHDTSLIQSQDKRLPLPTIYQRLPLIFHLLFE